MLSLDSDIVGIEETLWKTFLYCLLCAKRLMGRLGDRLFVLPMALSKVPYKYQLNDSESCLIVVIIDNHIVSERLRMLLTLDLQCGLPAPGNALSHVQPEVGRKQQARIEGTTSAFLAPTIDLVFASKLVQ